MKVADFLVYQSKWISKQSRTHVKFSREAHTRNDHGRVSLPRTLAMYECVMNKQRKEENVSAVCTS